MGMTRYEQYYKAKEQTYIPDLIEGCELNKIQMTCRNLGCGEEAYKHCVANVAYRNWELCDECKEALNKRYLKIKE